MVLFTIQNLAFGQNNGSHSNLIHLTVTLEGCVPVTTQEVSVKSHKYNN